jgi:hypothetical protein
VQRSLRPFLFLAASLAGAHACSLDLDSSLIPGAGGDASVGDAQSFGGFEAGGAWSDAKPDGTSTDANDGSDATTETSTEAGDSGPVNEGIDCGGTQSCTAVCCWDGNAGFCAQDPSDCTNLSLGCDATDDCGPGEVCCLLSIAGTVGCANGCADTQIGAIQFCDGDTECTAGMCGAPPSIIASLLPPGYQTCQ